MSEWMIYSIGSLTIFHIHRHRLSFNQLRSPLYLFSYIYLLFPFIYSQQTLDFWPVVKWESWITTVADISQTRKPELLWTSLVILNSVVGLLSNQLQLFNPLWPGVCKTSCWWNHHLNIFFFFFYFVAPEMLQFENVQPGSDMWTIGVITYCL